jgi:uncharacterized protein
MNTSIKNYLGIAGIIGILLIGWSAIGLSNAFSQSIQPSSFRNFSVSGEGKVVAIPDVAQYSFSVITEGGKDLAKSQTDNTTKVNKAIAYVKTKGVEAKDIKTSSYDVQPRYQYSNCNAYSISSSVPAVCPPPSIVGYTVTQSVAIKVRKFDTIGDMLTGVVQAGANNVSALSFTVDDPTALQNQAREEAISKAKDKAKSIARAGGFSLGRLLNISEGSVPTYRSYDSFSSGAAVMMKAESAPAPAIEAGSQDITSQVTLQYEIK